MFTQCTMHWTKVYMESATCAQSGSEQWRLCHIIYGSWWFDIQLVCTCVPHTYLYLWMEITALLQCPKQWASLSSGLLTLPPHLNKSSLSFMIWLFMSHLLGNTFPCLPKWTVECVRDMWWWEGLRLSSINTSFTFIFSFLSLVVVFLS